MYLTRNDVFTYKVCTIIFIVFIIFFFGIFASAYGQDNTKSEWKVDWLANATRFNFDGSYKINSGAFGVGLIYDRPFLIDPGFYFAPVIENDGNKTCPCV